MTDRTPFADEIVAKLWKNRGGEFILVQLRQYEGHRLCDMRVFFTDKAGISRPTRKGISVGIGRLPELANAIGKAVSRAKELGLITVAAESGRD